MCEDSEEKPESAGGEIARQGVDLSDLKIDCAGTSRPTYPHLRVLHPTGQRNVTRNKLSVPDQGEAWVPVS